MRISPYEDLAAEAAVPARGILSQTLSNELEIELVLFAFAAREELFEHTSVWPAIIHVLDVEGDRTVDGEAHSAGSGTWVRMPPNMKHGLAARTPMRMAFYLLPVGRE